MLAEDSDVDLIDGFPQIDIRNVNRNLQDLAPVTPGSFQYLVHIAERLFRLLLNATQLFLARLRVDRQLAGNENETVIGNRLGIMTSRCWSVRSAYSFYVHGSIQNTVPSSNSNKDEQRDLSNDSRSVYKTKRYL